MSKINAEDRDIPYLKNMDDTGFRNIGYEIGVVIEKTWTKRHGKDGF